MASGVGFLGTIMEFMTAEDKRADVNMEKKTRKIIEEILSMLNDEEKRSIPYEKIIEKLTQSYSTSEVERAVEQSRDQWLIDLVLDYPERKWEIYDLEYTWHLKLLTAEESARLQSLPSAKLAVVRLLQEQKDTQGEIESEKAKDILRERGVAERDLISLWVTGFVDNHYGYEDGKSIEWYRLIPEDEKTEEYKEEQELILRKSREKDRRRQRRTDELEMADIILAVLKDKPDGLSRDEIVKHLSGYPPEYFDSAFETAIDYEDIERVDHPSGKEWYRSIYDYGEDEE